MSCRYWNKLSVLTVLFFLGEVLVCSAASSRLRSGGKASDLPAVGLRFLTFRDTMAIPFPPAKQTGRVWTRRDTGKKVYGYDPVELWRNEQIIGQWKNDLITVIIARLTTPPPHDAPVIDPQYSDLSQEMYSAWKEQQKPRWERKEEVEWLHYYTGIKLVGNPQQVSRCKNPTYELKTDDPNQSSMVFLVRSQDGTNRRFMFYYQAQSRLSTNDRKAVLNSVKSVSITRPKATKIAEVKSSSRYKKTEWSDSYIASKGQVMASIQNMKGWKFLETENYIIVSNLRSGIMVKKFQDQLEKSRIAYQTFFPLKVKLDEVSVVKIFENRDEYLSYVGKDMQWTGGLWVPAQKELMISPLDVLSKSKNSMGMMATASHEGFHQYMHYAVRQAQLSTWFNEGMAAFFEGLEFSGSRYFKVKSTWRKTGLLQAIKSRSYDINRLINLSQEQYYEKSQVEHNYALGWGLMFYLCKGSIAMNRPQYSDVVKRYYEEILRSRDPRKATAYAWSKVDMAQFMRDFKRFWASSAYVNKAERLDIQRTLKAQRR